MAETAPGVERAFSPQDCAASAQRIMQHCEQLAALSSLPDGVFRAYLTPEHRACNSTVAQWMQQAGLGSWQDNAGNIWGRLAAAQENAPVLVVGSHLDTIPNAGKYDGILGVVLAVEAAARLRENGLELPFHLDIAGFGDEEGSRFGTTLMGSRAAAGRWNPGWLELRDDQGVSLAAALQDFGCDPFAMQSCDRSGEDLFAYLELHIEQGPVLEKQQQALGVVTSIAGARRFVVQIHGMAGHAGTVPMDMRRDALVAGATAVGLVESIGRRFDVVATVGQLQCWPGAPNVIPGECRFTIDIRSGRDSIRDLALDTLVGEIDAMVAARGLQIDWSETHNASAVTCASHLQRAMEDVLQAMHLVPVSLVSGAGHDAMSFDGITDVGMLFLRCAGGISHHPDECVEEADVAVATAAFLNLLLALGRRYSAGANG
ncbi:allantoate amidohydrolase [Haliea sp. E17]|uniref:allantoate amidohydrolase n=1 Tax=Haliea sp. E17 TaxID=3401576 RepID=UPI003AAE6422